jgi:single-stranded-DNA-specific exonuclease
VTTIDVRPAPPQAIERLTAAGLQPVLARLLAARGLDSPADLDPGLEGLLPPEPMKDLTRAATLIADALRAGQRICVVADYDCDGATGCAVAVRGLRMLAALDSGAPTGTGATWHIDYLVPNRFEHGYGLTPPVVDQAAAHPRLGRPDWIITVDNGIASRDGARRARELGIGLIVTDHHLPGGQAPDAAAIVNPNQGGCAFPSRHLAGVGVVFYLLIALRAELRRRGSPAARAQLQSLLDLVALGTVADLVRLDRNNRLLVAAGLRQIRSGRACAGLRALLRLAGRDARRATSADMGFALGPRINAAGRLADISVGIECLMADDDGQAEALARQLDSMNRERRRIEGTMREEALADLDSLPSGGLGIVVHREGWHEGVVGLVASRVKEARHRPTIALAPSSANASILRGSGRSIAGVHLRDVLDLVDKREPGLLLRFGGHAMAAGLSMPASELPRLAPAFDAALAELADPACFAPVLWTDGPLDPSTIDLGLLEAIEAQVWGQGFPEPLFSDRFIVERQTIVGTGHLRLVLRRGQHRLEAIMFGRSEPVPAQSLLAYRLQRNDWQGRAQVQLVIEAALPDSL